MLQKTNLPLLQRDLRGKHVLVTGGSAGLGAWAVRHFAAQAQPPASITLTCRNVSAGEAVVAGVRADYPAFEGELSVERVDLDRLADVRAFAARFNARDRALDILVANAGVSVFSYAQTPDGHERSLQANVLAQPLLALLLAPSFARVDAASSTPARVVIVSSEMHRQARVDPRQPWLQADTNYIAALDDAQNWDHLARYNLTKLLEVLLVRAFAEHLPRLGAARVEWVAVCPGFCQSELDRGLPWGLSHAMRLARALVARTTDDGARNFVWAALADARDGEGLRSGAYVGSCAVEPPLKWVDTDAGKHAQERIYQQTIEFFRRTAPEELADILPADKPAQ